MSRGAYFLGFVFGLVLCLVSGCSSTDITAPGGIHVKRTNLWINPEIRFHARLADGVEYDLGYGQTNSPALEKSLDLANAIARAAAK